jgi:LDH2 family malate/lactate/ureidoglycolate dehydrogenase
MVHLTEAQAQDLATRAFLLAGVLAGMARDASAMMTLAEMLDIASHCLARVPDYVDRLRVGGIDPLARPFMAAPAPALMQVDGRDGLGPAVAFRAV